ncbi:MAG: TetR/AcrR family transcriptional regulator [Solirubrobacterales bacterium]
MAAEQTRERIVSAADELIYRRGYGHTTFADFAEAVGISRGNFHYHFKRKDDLLDAVISKRRRDTSAMLRRFELESDTPAGQIVRFLELVADNDAAIRLYGCPVGTLCNELGKVDHGSWPGATAIFEQFREWLKARFELLGHHRDADELALHALVLSQGIATLSAALRDRAFVDRELGRARAWVEGEAATGSTASKQITKGQTCS